MYVNELKVEYRRRQVPMMPALGQSIYSSGDAGALLAAILANEVVEVFGVLCLTVKRLVIAYHELSRGTLDGTVAHPRDLLRVALLSNAAAVVVAHNHPSGDPVPSADDVALTARLRQALQLVDVELTDHVIVVTDGRFYSFREAGQL